MLTVCIPVILLSAAHLSTLGASDGVEMYRFDTQRDCEGLLKFVFVREDGEVLEVGAGAGAGVKQQPNNIETDSAGRARQDEWLKAAIKESLSE